MSDLLDDLEWRGLVADSTDREALEAHLAQGPVTFYVGIDPTAKSLHIGHLVQLMLVRAAGTRTQAVAPRRWGDRPHRRSEDDRRAADE